MSKLYRSEKNKVVAGVCSGLGEYTNISPKLYRIIFIIGLLFGFFPPIIIYLILWVLLEPSPLSSKSGSGAVVDVEPVVKVKDDI